MREPVFSSVLGPHIQQFVAEKRALGYRYEHETFLLRTFDRYLVDIGHQTNNLPKTVVDGWMVGPPHQSPKTRQQYVGAVRRFAEFLMRNGIEVYIPSGQQTQVAQDNFVPHVFTRDQMRQLLAAVDAIGPDGRSLQRHVVFPALFRVLYGCGLRCGEALRLTVGDVDLSAGVLTIREGKFRQDRLVPVASGLLERLRSYSTAMGVRPPEAVFFPAPHGGKYSLCTPYAVFRRALRAIGIPHHGRRHGPRLHDVRHTFAVHRMEDWYRNGLDLSAKLPVLATYMGHQSLAGTQHYLRLTAEVFPNLSQQLHLAYGHLIPSGPVP
jgi:integrase/recombinase XerD